ncbi:flavodoxin domain-containing protein [Seohaeicola saemankumensis]|uniref:flavodoxin domain-containing protein n=1 Tax=Seohaeicola saemankumensis TaxID=481181 RepID=UPI001E658DA0|nr:flavodoxin domain-containing protein [Seohaeicola saemankumensis]
MTMKILIAYATTEGQTRKIARFCADHLIAKGASVELLPLADLEDDDPFDISRFDAAILAGSLHGGVLQSHLSRFAAHHAADLSKRAGLFLMVSLAAAGNDPEERADIARIASEFAQNTGWTPSEVVHVAGAFRFTQYDFFKGLAMRWIAHSKGEVVDPQRDKEYTDWDALAGVLDRWHG